MKIAYVTAGAAGMYCGSCLHDNTLARALIALGHEVALIPTYTPIRTDEQDVSIDRVFYGAINVFLEEKTSLFRHTPRFLDRILNARPLLDWAARKGGSTDAAELGAMTVSVLQGEHGHQRKELERLIEWLGGDLRPDVVHLTNTMFLGMARRIREELRVPVVCSIQGEDLFLEQLTEPYKTQAVELLRERSRDVDAIVSNSTYYTERMRPWLDVSEERLHRVELGIDLEGFDAPPQRGEAPFVVGYLARRCPEKGLHVLVDAFRILAERLGREHVTLRIAGYLGSRDRPFVEEQEARLEGWGLGDRVEHFGEIDRAAKSEFLAGLHVLSVPTVYREPKGLYVIEALANGTPVVQPDHGAFPELLARTGGGELVAPEDPAALAGAWERLARDPAHRTELGRRGQAVVRRDYNAEVMARATLAVYRRCLEGGAA